ncbi:MAG TPA: aminopeptidase P family protein [Acidimicrobiales bacterium]|nr:aminopeptidase P family protein [Acidimicrobiales bacterium]
MRTPMDVAGRVPRLRDRFHEAGCDALLVTHLVNIRYLTAFTGSAALLLVRPDDLLFVTDGRYRDQSALELAGAGIEARIEVGLTGGRQKELVQEAAAGIARLGLEAAAVTWAQQRKFDGEWFPDAELVPTEGLVEELRKVKDAGEVERMAEAAAVADAALAAVRHRLAEGPTEEQFALELDFEMRKGGASAPSFDTIVASGPNGAKPHHRPSGRRIERGELVVVDFGAIVDGYCSDMTRTFCVGEPSSATARRMVEVVAESQRAGVAAVRAGVEGKGVDEICRNVIAEAGWADAFLHSTGHGVGLEIHEDPRVSSASTDTLVAGHVVTVEPGVYLPEHGGVRIEDTVVVTDEGCTVLTNAPKELAVL